MSALFSTPKLKVPPPNEQEASDEASQTLRRQERSRLSAFSRALGTGPNQLRASSLSLFGGGRRRR
jgi:hypothetical protein